MDHSIISAIRDSIGLNGVMTNALIINGDGEAHRDGKGDRRAGCAAAGRALKLFHLEDQAQSQAL